MAGIDWGVIALKNGKLMLERKYDIVQGAAGHIKIGSLIFDRATAQNSIAFQQINQCQEFTEESFYLNFDNELYLKNKYALTWQYNGTIFKTKQVGDSIYLTKFKYRDNFYQVLQGYDVSLESCYEKQTIKFISKLVPQAKIKLIR